METVTDSEVEAYYARDEERDRLGVGVGRVEFLRTLEIVQRTLPAAGAVVADIGGGPGRYVAWLVEHGYSVVHRDLIAHHVQRVLDRHGGKVDTAVNDARALDLVDASVDVVLLLGPLYHLEDRSDRVRALREAARVVRPGGHVYAAAISRTAPRLDGVLVAGVHRKFPGILELLDDIEATGRMPPLEDGGFCGYAHSPAELQGEVEAAGLALESLVSIEGLAFALADIDERLADEQERDILFECLRATESHPDLIGLGPHLLATAARPN